jgi:hypothetical protein
MNQQNENRIKYELDGNVYHFVETPFDDVRFAVSLLVDTINEETGEVKYAYTIVGDVKPEDESRDGFVMLMDRFVEQTLTDILV